MKRFFLFIIPLLLAAAFFAPEPAFADFRDSLNQQLEATAGAQGANFGEAQGIRRLGIAKAHG